MCLVLLVYVLSFPVSCDYDFELLFLRRCRPKQSRSIVGCYALVISEGTSATAAVQQLQSMSSAFQIISFLNLPLNPVVSAFSQNMSSLGRPAGWEVNRPTHGGCFQKCPAPRFSGFQFPVSFGFPATRLRNTGTRSCFITSPDALVGVYDGR